MNILYVLTKLASLVTSMASERMSVLCSKPVVHEDPEWSNQNHVMWKFKIQNINNICNKIEDYKRSKLWKLTCPPPPRGERGGSSSGSNLVYPWWEFADRLPSMAEKPSESVCLVAYVNQNDTESVLGALTVLVSALNTNC